MTTKVAIEKVEDFSGKNRIIWNTLVSWASHLVLVVSGFIMPRLMDELIGQVQLGIWDFCWAFISYLSLVGLGVGASSNRYIAKYRSEKNTQALSSLISSAFLLESFIFIAILSGSALIIYFMPFFFGEQLGENLSLTQMVMFYLGISLAITTLFSTYRGILTGHHRWDIHNGLTGAYSVVSLLFMMGMLFAGFGIEGMAQGYFLATVIFEFVRVIVARKYCSDIVLSKHHISKKVCAELLGFTVKGKIAVLPPVVLLQTINILIVNAFGPAVLAIFSRPLALTRHISTFMVKFTMILTPTAGAMLGDDKSEELKTFFITTTKFSFAFTLPLVIGLAIFGDIIVGFWMGADYVNWSLIVILSLGALLPTAQDGALRILIAKNEHGKISVYMAIIVLISCSVGYFYSRDDFTLIAAAYLLIIPRNLAYGLALPWYACNRLSINISNYLLHGVLKPLLSVSSFAVLLCIAKYYYLEKSYSYTAVLVLVACMSLLFSYAFILLNHAEKKRFLSKFF